LGCSLLTASPLYQKVTMLRTYKLLSSISVSVYDCIWYKVLVTQPICGIFYWMSVYLEILISYTWVKKVRSNS